MFLGIILACMSLEDATSCIPIPNVVRFYETLEDCYTDAEQQDLMITERMNLNTAVFCYETDYFEEA